MFAFRPRLRPIVVAAAALALVVVGSGSALAGSNPPVVYACFTTSGAVAMATIAQCKLVGGGQIVRIDTQGTPGPTGQTGATGSTGPTGPTGPGTITQLLTVPMYGEFLPVHAAPAFTIKLTCGTDLGDLTIAYDITNLAATPMTYAIGHQGADPTFVSLPASRQVIGGWDTVTHPGAADIWVSSGSDAFHAVLAASFVPGTTTCQPFVTY